MGAGADDVEYLRSRGIDVDVPGLEPPPGTDAPAEPDAAQTDEDYLRSRGIDIEVPGLDLKAQHDAIVDGTAPAPDRSLGGRVVDALSDTDTWLAFAKGAAQGLGKYGEPIGHAFADLTARQTGKGLYPGQGGTPGETVKTGKSLLESVPENGTTMLAQTLGTAATGIPAMLGAGPGVGAQAAMGALLGGSRGGEEGGAAGALSGAALGGLAGGVGGAAAKYGVPALAQKEIPAWAALGGLASKPIPTAALLATRAAAKAAPYETELAARGLGGLAAGLGGTGANYVGSKLKEAAGYSPVDTFTEPAKAKAQDVAYAGTPTTSWAVQSVLTSGTHGLSPQDEQRLTEAVMSGDDQKVISTNFLLSQRNPAYAKRMQDEYESLQHGGE